MKIVRKQVAKKKSVKTLSFHEQVGIKMLVLSAQVNAFKAQVIITVRQWAAKLRGH